MLISSSLLDVNYYPVYLGQFYEFVVRQINLLLPFVHILLVKM